ncbi:unnamed protein product [Peronospora effusa]|nr:unnamed protein product [Peronospora effusa]
MVDPPFPVSSLLNSTATSNIGDHPVAAASSTADSPGAFAPLVSSLNDSIFTLPNLIRVREALHDLQLTWMRNLAELKLAKVD